MKRKKQIRKAVEGSREKLIAQIFKKGFERFRKESKWLTSVGLALLGFFTALLIQLKLSGTDPLDLFTFFCFLFLIVSLISGFALKFSNVVEDFEDFIRDKLLRLVEQEVERDLESAKIDKGPEEIMEEVGNSKANNLLVFQIITLGISLVLIFIYLLIFLSK